MISLGAARIGTLKKHRSGLVSLMRLFPRMWHVLQTTDIIVRTERWSRIREILESQRAMGHCALNPEMPWDAVIAQSAYGAEGHNALWWQSHFVLPCSLSAGPAAATSMIKSVEGQSSQSSSSAAPPPPPAHQNPRPTKPRQQKSSTGKPEVCLNFNRRLGRCMKDGVPCPANRLHVCDVCGESHRSIDKQWNKSGGDGGKYKSGNQAKKSRR